MSWRIHMSSPECFRFLERNIRASVRIIEVNRIVCSKIKFWIMLNGDKTEPKTGQLTEDEPSQKAAFSSSVNFVLKASSSTALRIALGVISPGMPLCENVESEFHVEAQGNEGVLFEGRRAISLQSLPGLAKIRIGNKRSMICSLKVVRSFTLKRNRI